MTDLTKVEFTVDGYKFTKSIEDAETVVRDLKRRIQLAWIYRNLPFNEGRVTRQYISDILIPYMIEWSAHGDELSESDRLDAVATVWRRICDDSDGRMFCPHCNGLPCGDHTDALKDRWEINIFTLVEYLRYLLRGHNLDDWGIVRECFEYLRVHIDNLIVASR